MQTYITHTHTHHFWVIALIVTNGIDTTQDPTKLFPCSPSTPAFNPGAIVAEIDNHSTSVNDLLEFCRNGPLTPWMSYTVFGWGILPSPLVSMCSATSANNNLSNTDTLGPLICVLLRKVSSFQEANNTFIAERSEATNLDD